MDAMSMAIISLIWSAPWIAGVVISWVAYRRRKSAGLRLALTAFASLVALQIFFGTVIVLVWNNGAGPQNLNGISLFFQFGRSGLVILLAIAFFRVLQEKELTIPSGK